MITKTYPNLRAQKTKMVSTVDANGAKMRQCAADGELAGDILITIDIDGIARSMGRRALLNKTKKCIDGFVTVRAVNIRHLPGKS